MSGTQKTGPRILGTRILGIDPGLATVGLGLVVFGERGRIEERQWGVITTSKGRPDGSRLAELYEDLTGVVKTLQPDCVSLEKLFFFRNATTMVPVSQARGVILLVLEQAGIPVFEYTPMQVKQAMTGYGKATKQEVQEMVAKRLDLEKVPRPDDAADALAMAFCHEQFSRIPMA